MNKPKLKLVGEDGNAFAILGRARVAAKKAGWSKEKISAISEEARSGDYNHLLATMIENFDTDGDDDEEDEEEVCDWCGEVCGGWCEDDEDMALDEEEVE